MPDVLGGVSASDSCSGTNGITLSQSPAAGTLVGLGVHTITVTATDAATNSATCTTTFTVTDDTAPTVICSATPSASAGTNCLAAVPDVLGGVSASDSCSGTNGITLSQSPAAGTLVGLGVHVITVTATDAATNSATCTTSFTVTDDTAPTVSCPAPTSASAGTNCLAAVPDVLGGVSASDSCSGTNGVTLSQSPAAGTLVGLGVHVITVTATDAATNSATCTTTFTVTDDTAPTVSCPAPTSASAGTNCLAAVSDVLGGVSASDSCSGTNGITLVQSPAAGTLVGLGTHTITVTPYTALFRSATCTTTFTVTDATVPTVSCPAPTSASADGTCQAVVPNVLSGVTASDSCSGTNGITMSQSPTAGTLMGLGANTITVTATDEAGNSATCTTTFTVIDATVPSVSCPAPTSASAGAGCQAAVPNVLSGVTASDNCSATNGITLVQSPAAGTLVGLGTNTITVTATDEAGNSATCTTTFTVNDTTAPSVSCSAVPAASAEGACQAAVPNVLGGVTAIDSCSATNAITLSQSPAAGTLVGLGAHTITVTATDDAGNSATCTTTFTVSDTTVPSVSCSAVPAASADGSCQAAVPDGQSGVSGRSSCSATNAITLSQSPAAGTLVGLGTHTITVTATDEAGNSATCTTTVTVTDNTAPSVSCPAVPNASADDDCEALVPDVLSGVTVSDSCSPTNAITLSQ